jgi:hypothetical protein
LLLVLLSVVHSLLSLLTCAVSHWQSSAGTLPYECEIMPRFPEARAAGDVSATPPVDGHMKLGIIFLVPSILVQYQVWIPESRLRNCADHTCIHNSMASFLIIGCYSNQDERKEKHWARKREPSRFPTRMIPPHPLTTLYHQRTPRYRE